MTAPEVVRKTAHWLVVVGDQPREVHLVFTPRAGDRVDELAAMHLDERQDLHSALMREIDDRGLRGYEVAMRCVPDVAVQVHLTAGPSCPGFEVNGQAEAELRMLLGGRMACPLCGQATSMWQIRGGTMRHHDPGE
jgi:hypothetical protein